MGCHRLDSLTPTGFIPQANYPMFRREECIRINGRWVHLRICQTCGKMLCGDSSEHQHARRHHEETGHPVMRSAEPGEQWLWCYVDKAPKIIETSFGGSKPWPPGLRLVLGLL